MKSVKNYTSTVPPDRTLARIEALLAEAGCRSVRKDYEAGEVSALVFLLPVEGGELAVRMPADVEAVRKLLHGREARTPARARAIAAQARRTAWKVMQDWLEVQLSLIRLGQADPAQVFLGYVVDHRSGETIYQALLRGGGLKQLGWKGGATS